MDMEAPSLTNLFTQSTNLSGTHFLKLTVNHRHNKYLHHPSGVGIDGVVKIFRLIYFSVMCCRKFVLRNVTLGPLFQKRNQARQ